MGEVIKAKLLTNNVPIAASVGGSLAQRAYSPTVELTETEEGVRIEMTDVNGTQEATVYNGEDYVLTEEDREEIADIAKDSMDYDDVPTDGSGNLITSGVVKEALDLKADKTELPVNVSELNNDAGYLTQHQDISGKQDVLTFDDSPQMISNNPVKSSGIWNAITLAKNDVQGNVDILQTQVNSHTGDIMDMKVGKQNKLTFDSAPTENSTNPVTSGGVYNAIANISTMDVHVCASGEYNSQTGVPVIASPDAKTFYLVPGGEDNNLYIEWVYVNGAWEQFGSATVDLSGYALKSELPQNVSDLTNDAGYLTAHQDISGKQDVLTFDDAPTAGSNNPVKSGGINTAISALRSDMQYFDNQNSKAINDLQMNTSFSLSQKQDVLTFDNTPTANSNNPVKSGGVKSAIDAVAGNIPGIIVNSTAQEKAAIRTAIGAENGDDIVKVQDAQPTGAATKIWIPETMPQGVQVPTQTEFEELSDRVTEALTWIGEADDNFKTGDDDLLQYSKSTHRIPLANNEHRTIIDQDDGGIYINSDGQERGMFYFYNDTSHLPAWFIPGQTYRLEYEGISGIDIPFRIYIYPDGKTSDSYAQNILWANHSCVFTAPQNMTGLSMRIHYDITNVAFEHTFYPKLYLLNAPMEPEMSFDYDPVTIPQEVIGWQDFEKVGNHIWMFTASNDNHTTADGLIDILDADWTYIKSIPHNIGHCNTVSYDADTDSLLVTSCVADNETITIFRNVSQWENLNTIDYANVDKIVIDLSDLPYDMGYNNACWGEKKRDGFRYIYVASSIGTMWTKLELATENGYYTSAHTALWQIGCDRNTVSGINTSQVIQGMTFYNGKVYGSLSHNPIHGAVYTFARKKAKREIIHVDGTGLVDGNEGCMIMNGNLYLGCSSWTGAESAPVVVKVQVLGAISNQAISDIVNQ